MGVSYDTFGKPVISATPTQTVPDMQAGPDFAMKHVVGIVQTSSYRAAMTSGEFFEGMLFIESDTGDTYKVVSGAWKLWHRPVTAYTPTLTGFSAGGGGTVVGRYTVIQGKAEYWVDVTLGSGFGVTGAMYVSVPLAASSAIGIAGEFFAFGPASARYQGMAGFDNPNRVWMLRTDNNFLSNTAWAWASGNRVSVHGSYLLP